MNDGGPQGRDGDAKGLGGDPLQDGEPSGATAQGTGNGGGPPASGPGGGRRRGPGAGRRRKPSGAGGAGPKLINATPPRQSRDAKRGTGALPAIRPELRPDTPVLRAERVEAIRRDLVRRRRRKGARMLLRLFFAVTLPTLIVAWFLLFRATPLFASHATFLVQGAEGQARGGGSAISSLFGGGSTASLSDSVAVQNFVLSRDVLRRLDAEFGLIDAFKSPDLDWLERLDRGASFEEAYRHYLRRVTVSFDPAEGILEMTVIDATPEQAQRLSQAILGYAEVMVDELSSRIRSDTLADAQESFAAAEKALADAQTQAAELRKSLATFSIETEISKETQILTQLELELENLRTKLTTLYQISGTDDPRIQRLQLQIQTLERRIAARERAVTGSTRSQLSLTDINAELERASFDVEAAMSMFTAAIETLASARISAQRQHRYLSVIVAPSRPDMSTYPNVLRSTALAFLVLLGTYIVATLTISLIREQASV